MKTRLYHSDIYRTLLIVLCVLANGLWLKEADSVKFCGHNDSTVNLINNGYESIGVWISENIPEDLDLIRQFEELISKFSVALYQFTKKRAYVRKVQILIPHAWHPPEDFPREISSNSTNLVSESQAHIWIRNSSPRNDTSGKAWKIGDTQADVVLPYVIKTTPCGFPGSYVRISSEFIRFGGEDAVMEKVGLPENILVREWAKLRWGVYDELPRVNDLSNYYLRSNLAVQPIICSSTIPGNNVNTKTSEPNCNPEISLYDKTCRFEPTNSQSKAFGSLLYRANLPYINDFCDDAELTTPEKAHDEEAPTTHNLHCRGRSVWNVMREHPDFVDGNNPPSSEDVPPATEFNLVQHENERIVLVLDISSSMRVDGKLELMRQAVSHFIDTVPESTYIGIVCFAGQALIKQRLLQVRHDDIRNHLKKRIVNVTKSGTSIGSGIRAGIRVLNVSGPSHLRGIGGSIIILTDGREHNRPKINETISQVKASGVTVSTIALGSNIARDLESLAVVSGGKTHAASIGEFGISTELQEAFSSHHEHVDGGAIPLLSEEIVIPANSNIEKKFVIDASIGKDTRITLFYSEIEVPLIKLRSPFGKLSTPNDLQDDVTVQHVDEFKTIYMKILDNSEPGNWTISLTNSNPRHRITTRVNVVSYQQDDEPLLISPALLCRFVDFTGEETMVVYASVSKGELAVLSASVFADITRPLTTSGVVDSKRIYLRDDGLGPDITPSDGVYSAYFTSFTIMGRYNVKISASDNNGQATMDSNYILGIGNFHTPSVKFDTRYLLPQKRKKRNITPRKRRAVIGLKLSPFQRVSSVAGAFVVQSFNAQDNCNNGYRYFQDSCYRVIATPLASNSGQAVCEHQGGYLAQVNSRQELAWLLTLITDANNPSSGSAWIGDVDEEFRDVSELNIEESLSRLRRGVEDIDLDTLATAIGRHSCADDLLNSFEPDIQDLSSREINKLVDTLGLDSERDLADIAEIITRNTPSGTRRKRRSLSSADVEEPFPLKPSLQQSFFQHAETTTSPIDYTDETTVYTQEELNDDDLVMSQIERDQRALQFQSSGDTKPTCYWFHNGKIIRSEENACEKSKKFICEKSIRDRFPPSRIVDLKGRFDPGKKLLNLTWSAPGDDFNVGKAERYEIRTLRTRRAVQALNSDLEKSESLDISEESGNGGTPARAGSTERVLVNVTDNSLCPPHAVLDMILALPPFGFGTEERTSTKKKLTLQFVNRILEQFDINEYEVSVAVMSLFQTFQPIVSFSENLNQTEIEQRLDNFVSTNSTKRTINEAVESMFENGGREEAAKVMLVVTDGNLKFLSDIAIDAFNITKIVVYVGSEVNKFDLWNVVSSPPCLNSFVAKNEELLVTIAPDVIRQVCQARVDEFQAIAVKAYDDAKQSGDLSNVFPFVMKHSPMPFTCDEIFSQNLFEAGNTATVVALSVGIPFAAILGVLGSVIVFGQIKKYRKKRLEKKQMEEEEEKMKEMLAARQRKPVKANASNEPEAATDATEIGNKNNNNSGTKAKKVFGKWRTAPMVGPLV